MKRIYLFLVLCVLGGALNAQTISSYTYNYNSSGTFTAINGVAGTTTLSTISLDDATQQNIPLGFTFGFTGTSTTTISACSNGWLSLANSSSTTYSNSSASVPGAGFIMPFWDDLSGSGAVAYYSTTGTAPTRVFTFQWGDATNGWYSSSAGGRGCFQVKLYEGTNVIQFVYGTPRMPNSTTATIGIANSGTSGNYQTIPNNTSTTASSTTFTVLASGSAGRIPTANTVLTFSPSPFGYWLPATLSMTAAPSSTSPAASSVVSGYGLTSAGTMTLSLTGTNASMFQIQNPVTSAWMAAGASTTYSATSGTLGNYDYRTVNVRFVGGASTGTYTATLNYSGSGYTGPATMALTGIVTAACTGIPTPGTAQATGTPACGSYTPSLSLSGTSTSAGITFQWQSSVDNATFSDISGATAATLSPLVTSPKYFRCVVTCSASSQSANSNSVYCAPNSCMVSGATTTMTTCSSSFYSSGGSAGGYSNSESGVYTFYPSVAGNSIRAAFSSLGTEAGYDSITVYDGNSVAATRLGSYSGTTSPGTFTSSAADGSLTFRFMSDVSTTSTGFAAAISCVTLAACTGTPTGGTVASSGTVACGSYAASLSVTGSTTGVTGISYQWQSSANNTTFADISGATAATYGATIGTTNVLYYRRAIKCAGSGITAYSSSVQPAAAYVCLVSGSTTSVTNCGVSFYSSNGPTGSYSNSENGTITFYPVISTDRVRATFSAFASESGYDSLQVFDGNSTSANRIGRYMGSTSPGTISSSASDGSLTFKWQSDGSTTGAGWTAAISCFTPPPTVTPSPTSLAFGIVTMGTSSATQNITISGANLTSGGTLTITASANFQVSNGSWVTSYNYPYTGTSISGVVIPVQFNPTLATGYTGTITITGGGLASPVTVSLTGTGANTCSGAPATPTASATATNSCAATSTTLSVPVSAASGVTYQWYSSSDNVTFNIIAGATNIAYTTAITTTAYYKCVETCTSSSLTSSSNTIAVTGNITGFATLPFTEDFEAAWINQCGTKDAPNGYWKNTPVTTDSSWRREDDAASSNTAVWGNNTSYLYSPAFSSTAHSARFHSGYVSAGRRGILDLYVNMGSAASKKISYDYINTSGSDFFDVYISTDGGATFSASLDHATTTSGWSSRSFTTSVSNAATIIRFIATADYGSTDIGLDNVKVEELLPIFTASPASLSFGNVAVGGSTTLSTTISGAYCMPSSGTITISAPAGYTLYNGSAYVSSYTTTYSASGSTIALPTIIAKFSPVTGIAYGGSITITGGGMASPASIPVTGNGLAACSATPVAGTATPSATTGCAPSYATTLSLSGTTVTTGLIYQWYSGTDGVTYGTTISGATNATYTATVSSAIYYRATVTCPTYPAATSAGVQCAAPGTATPPYNENFDAAASVPCGWSVVDANNDGSTWTVGTTTSAPTGFSSPYYAIYHWNGSNPGNDWLFTKPLNLIAGYTYNITFKYGSAGGFTEGIEVKWGAAASAAGMTFPVLFSNTSITSSTMATSPVMSITPSATGTYYVGFHAISPTNQFYLYMDDFAIGVNPACTGTPSPGATIASVSSGCTAYSSTMSMSGSFAGTSGISYQWQKSTGSGYTDVAGATSATYTNTITGLSESYQCVVTCSASGLSAISTPVTVTVGPQPAAITGNNSVCVNQSITLANTVSGGTWSSTNTSIATINSSGVVFAQSTVGSTTISYAIGSCYSTYVVGVGNSSPAAITGAASSCVGASSTLLDATSGGVWSSNNTSVATVVSTTGVVTGTGFGTTTITYSNGCGTASTTTWTTNGTSVALASNAAAAPICSGTTLSLTSGTVAGGTYSWTGPNGYTSAAQNATISSATPLASGIYTFTATVGGCATGSSRINVMVDAIPTVTVTSPSVCPGGSTTITASSVLPATGSNNYSVNAISYQLFDTTGTAVSAGDDGTVSASIPFTFTFFGTNYTSVNISRNGYINFGAAVSSDYTPYAMPSTSAPKAMIALFWHDYYSTANSIKYTTVGTTPNRKFIVSYNNIPDRNSSTLAPSTTNFSNGQIVLYETSNVIDLYVTKNDTDGTIPTTCGIQNNNRTIGYNVPGQNLTNYVVNYPAGTGWRFAVPSYSYTWSPATALNATTGITVTSSGLTSATSYTVNATDIYSGCTTGGNAGSTVSINALPVVTVPAVGCAGTAMTAGGANTYSWTPATGLNTYAGATVTPQAAITASTTYTVTGTSSAGCVSTNTVTAYPAPVLSVTPTSGAICAGGNSTLAASGAATYSWIPAATLSAATGALVTATPSATTTYTLSGVSAVGCASLVQKTSVVTVNARPLAATLSAASGYCLGSGSPFTINTGTPAGTGTLSSYNWTGPDLFATTTSSPTVSFTPSSTAASGVYSLTVTYPGSGCISNAVTTGTVTVADYPVAYNVTGGNGCTSTGITIGLSGSQSSAYSYALVRAPSATISTLSGNNTTLSYGLTATAGTYSVIATGPAGCQTTMTGNDVVSTSASIALGAAPSVCQPLSGLSVGYSSALGSPNTYNVTWGTAATAAGFAPASGPLSGASIPLSIPSTAAVGSFDGDISVSNSAGCASGIYPVHFIVYANPTVTVTSVNVPCVGYAGSIDFAGTDSATVSYTVDGGSVNYFTFAGTTHNLGTGSITSAHNYVVLNASNPVCSTAVNYPVTIDPTPMAWQGGTAGHEHEWSATTNWTCGFVPTVSDDVKIDAAMYAPVVLSTDAAVVRNLLTTATSQLSLSNGAAINVKGTLTNNGEISGEGKLLMNGSAAQMVKGIGAISNFDMDNSAGVTVDTGSRLMIGKTLYITSGTLYTNDSLELLSKDTFTTARIASLPSSGAAISGMVKSDQFIQGGYRRYRFLSHPFSNTISLSQVNKYVDITGAGGSLNGFQSTASNAPSSFRLDPSTGNDTLGYDPGWKAFTKINGTADTNQFHPGQSIRLFIRGAKGEGLGYTGLYGMYVPSATTIQMIGNVNQGPVTVDLIKGTTNPDHQEFNMVGNPYASPVDIGTILYTAKSLGQITGSAFYVWDPTTAGGGSYTTVPIGIGAPAPYYLQANAGFQVRAEHNGARISFTESDKRAATNNYLFKEPAQYVTLDVYDKGYNRWDMLRIQFNEAATAANDKDFDAIKALGSDFTFYSLSEEGRKMAIDARPFNAEKVIPLGITTLYEQEFIIRADNIAVPEGGSVYLHDKLLNKVVEMKAGTEYSFTVGKDKTTQGDNRFELSMKSTVATAAVKNLAVAMSPNPATDDVKITFTSGTKDQVSVRVMDMSGISIYSHNFGEQQNGVVSVPLSTFAAGIYMVELTQGSQKVTQKLIKE